MSGLIWPGHVLGSSPHLLCLGTRLYSLSLSMVSPSNYYKNQIPYKYLKKNKLLINITHNKLVAYMYVIKLFCKLVL